MKILTALIVVVALVAFAAWKFPKARGAIVAVGVALGAGVAAFWESIAPFLGVG